MAQNYNDTIHKMQTPFEMRAGLPKKEPKMLEDWENNHVYEQMIKNNEGKPQYILHDGPPYANGNIHMGTALNKIIKDIIIRYKNMTGFEAPYVPGYDTHGLPIELKALSSLGDKKAGVSKLELRKICKEFATEHIDVMNSQFKRLGVQGDFENPYLTLRPEFEARQVEIFGEMAKKGYIYKGMKAVYWCPEDRTALAEAEIEYAEDECDSIYVRFKLTDDPNGVLAKHNIPLDKAWIVIWTTTTWTLPANVATCLNPNLEYAFVKIGDAYHIMAAGLVESTMKGCHIDEYEVLPETVLGSELELMQYQHPFLDRKGLVILGDHVTLEGGTGCVHTAPGHGVEDFEVCINHYPQVPVVVPVDDAGRLTAEAGEKFAGLKVWDANKVILEHIKESKIIAIVRGIPSTSIVDLVEAMVKGGVSCVEVTFDQSSEEKSKDSLKAISLIRETFGDRVAVGAGTVMTVEQVHQAVEAGAEYMISPNTNEAVIRETKKLGKISIPGACTPSEAADAYAWGADIVKIFPAGVFGPAYMKALKAPLKHIPMTAVGGISPENCADFIKAGCIGVGCGGNLVSAKLVSEGRFDEITKTAEAYIKALNG